MVMFIAYSNDNLDVCACVVVTENGVSQHRCSLIPFCLEPTLQSVFK